MFYSLTEGIDLSRIHAICIMILCLGNFLFAITWCVRFYESKYNLMILHHIVFIVIITTSLVPANSETDVRMVIFFSELSHPMLLIRYFMRQSGITDGILYEVNDAMFAVTFAVCRFGIGSYYLYSLVLQPKLRIAFIVSRVALYLVSLAFMAKISVFVIGKSPGMFKIFRGDNKQPQKIK